jgi:hypothetical protein
MTMDPAIQKLLLKVAYLWLPAASLLVWMWLRKIKSVIIYLFSSANLVCYLLWFGAMVVLHSESFYRWWSEFKDLHLISAFVVVLCPLVAVLASFILLVACIVPKPREQLILFPANLLMLILWGSSITWLN